MINLNEPITIPGVTNSGTPEEWKNLYTKNKNSNTPDSSQSFVATPTLKTTPTPKKTQSITKVAAKPLAQETKKATIWNPNTGEKKVVNVGDPVPSGWSLWTGGTASGEKARQAIWDKQKQEEPTGDNLNKRIEDIASGALDNRGQESTEVEPTETKTPTETKYENPQISDILQSFGIQKITPPDFSSAYENLDKWREAQFNDIDLKYEKLIADQQKKNENLTAGLKAKLIKAGVSLDGTSFQSAVASQEERNQKAIQELERMKAREKAAVNSGYYQNRLNLEKEERDSIFNANVENINNLFKGYNLATNIWESFNKRSADERKLEQDAQEHLDKMNLEWAKLDQDQKEQELKMLQDYINRGVIDVYNDDNVQMLKNIENRMGLSEGELIEPAIGAYWDRMSNIALKDAQTQNMIANTEKTKTLLPYQMEKYKNDIMKSRARISGGGSGSGGGNATATNALSQIEKQMFGIVDRLPGETDEEYKQRQEEARRQPTYALGKDNKLDTKKYKQAMYDFIDALDPKKKNENYYRDMFMDYFPPTAYLNENDKTAQGIIQQYQKRGSNEVILG